MAGTRRGVELLLQQRHELTSDIRISDESPNLPPVHPAEDPIPEHLRHRPRDASDHGRGEEPDRLRPPERRHFAVVRVQQHQPSHPLGVVECPVNGGWARGVVRDEEDLLKPQLDDDGIQVTDLIGGGIRIAGWLIRTAPPKKIKENDSAWRREVRNQTIVEVYVVREPMHQNDRWFRARVVSDIDPVLVPLHKSLLVDHHSLRKGCHPTCISDDPQKTPLQPQNAPDARDTAIAGGATRPASGLTRRPALPHAPSGCSSTSPSSPQ